MENTTIQGIKEVGRKLFNVKPFMMGLLVCSAAIAMTGCGKKEDKNKPLSEYSKEELEKAIEAKAKEDSNS